MDRCWSEDSRQVWKQLRKRAHAAGGAGYHNRELRRGRTAAGRHLVRHGQGRAADRLRAAKSLSYVKKPGLGSQIGVVARPTVSTVLTTILIWKYDATTEE